MIWKRNKEFLKGENLQSSAKYKLNDEKLKLTHVKSLIGGARLSPLVLMPPLLSAPW